MKLSATMKKLWFGLTAGLLVSIAALTGCSKKVSVDTVKLEYSFQTADAATQTSVNEAVESIEGVDPKVAFVVPSRWPGYIFYSGPSNATTFPPEVRRLLNR